MKLVTCTVLFAIFYFTQIEAKSYPRNDQTELRKWFLAQHNYYRKKHGVPKLVLDPELTSYAQEWANELARSDVLMHNPASANRYGENIYSTSASDMGKSAVKSWYSESKLYTDYSNDPSLTGYPDFNDIGHFTQVVWKNTKRLGVATATSKKGNTYVVANYLPPGNFKGSYVANVLPPKS